MSTVLVGTGQHVDAVMIALSASLPSWSRAFRPQETLFRDKSITNYVQVHCERRYVEDARVTPQASIRSWRVRCEWVVENDANGDVLEAACAAALEQTVLHVGEVYSTPVQHQVTEATGQDNRGQWTGYTEYTYTI